MGSMLLETADFLSSSVLALVPAWLSWELVQGIVCGAYLLICGIFPSQDPWGHSPCSWCPDVPAMAPWANPLNCWPTASKLKSQRLMSTSMRWISNQISVLGGWTGEKIHLSCKLYRWACWVTSRAVKGRISFLFPTSQLGGESAAAHSAWRGSQCLSSSWSTLG